MQSLVTNFPNAEFASESFRKINNFLLNEGFTDDNALFASSVCVDEINHVDNSLNHMLKEFWGESFMMGGLAGIPFIGKVGFGAFSAHIPKDGNLVILFAPHVGVSPIGTIGKFHREGQEHCDKACGAAIGGLLTLDKNPPKEGEEIKALAVDDPHNFQFDFITHALQEYYHDIKKSPNEQAALAYAMYDIVLKYIRTIVKVTTGKIALIGGIQINVKAPCEEFFNPLMFEIHEVDKPVRDLFPAYMKDLTYNDSTE